MVDPGDATDYMDKIWPFDYAWAYYRSYDSEFVPLAQQFASEPLAGDPTVPRTAAAATVGYLWDDAYKPRRQLPRLRRGHPVRTTRTTATAARSPPT